MLNSAVFTFVCDDRPGLVEALANTVRDQGGNWLESKLSHLAGKFAGVVRVSVEENRYQGLQEALGQLSSQGINVTLSKVSGDNDANGATARLAVIGHDRPGIVHEIARALASHDINIMQLESAVSSAPMAGSPMFEAQVHIQTPNTLSKESVEDELHDVSDLLDVDISLEWE